MGVLSLLLYVALAAWMPLLPDNVYTPLLDLGKISGTNWVAAGAYAGFVVGLFTLYAAGYRLVRGGAAAGWAIWSFAALFALPLLLTYPASAADVFGYVAHGRLLALHGSNPFAVAPDHFPHDPILPYLAFPSEPSQYGPMWVLLGAAITRLAGAELLGEVLLYKGLGFLAHAVNSALIYALARRLGADRRAALASLYLFAWNPLLLWEMVANAHNDELMMVGVLAALLFFTSRNGALTLPALAAGALIKLPAVVLAPLLALAQLRRRPDEAIVGSLLAVLLAAGYYAPFWFGPGTVTALGREDLFTASLGGVLWYALRPEHGPETASQLSRWMTRSLFAAAYALVLLRMVWARADRQVVLLCYAAMLALLLLGITWFQAWYVVWPFALGAALADSRRHLEVALLSLGAMLSYLVFVYLWGLGVFSEEYAYTQYAAYAVIVGPLLLLWLLWAARWLATRGRTMAGWSAPAAPRRPSPS